jgi:hypothetical protein
MSRTEDLLQFVQEDDVLEPDTLRQLYPDLSEEEFNKTMALKVLKHTRQFWENFYAFEDITLALNDIVPDFTKLDGCTPEQIWYAVQLADQIRPGLEYSKEVQLYIKFMCNDAGVFIYPPQVGLENPYLEKAKELSVKGPFPLGETTEEIQAGKYLSILEYLNEKLQKL